VADLLVRKSALTGIPVPVELIPIAIDELPVLFHRGSLCDRRDSGDGRRRAACERERPNSSDERGPAVARRGAQRVCRMACESRVAAQVRHSAAAKIDSFGDHRIAMSFSVASLRAAKSIFYTGCGERGPRRFPGFVGLARSVGLDVRESAA